VTCRHESDELTERFYIMSVTSLNGAVVLNIRNVYWVT